jgi:sialic acid synthase SpsE
MINQIKAQLGQRIISASDRPYVIAEIGVNHEGSLDKAMQLIDLAKMGGADAAKFQSYKADTLASKHSPAYWDTTKEPTLSQHKLFQKYDNFGKNEYIALAEHCRNVGIEFLSTPFDDAAIEFLDPLMAFFKIASADITNIPFLRKVAGKGKPVLLSTGASTLAEVDIAVKTLTHAGCQDIILLHCVLNYPTDNANAHLRMITGLQRAYPDKLVGYSDHTLPDDAMTPLLTAFLLGATVIEKHFTYDKSLPGNDHYHAMDTHDLARFISLIERVQLLKGPSDHKAPIATEDISRLNARRSIVVSVDVPAGHRLDQGDLTCKRPGTGISPTHWDEVVGSVTSRPLRADDVLQWKDIEQLDTK